MSAMLLSKREDRTAFILKLTIVLLMIALFFVAHNIFTDRMMENALYQSKIENINHEVERLQGVIAAQKEHIKEYTEIIDLLNNENISLQNTIKMFAFEGKKPENYVKPTMSISRGAVSRFRNMRFVGEWVGTAYTPSVEECGNDKGITSSGKPIIPGYSVAVDTDFWDYGQKFYIEGVGMVEAMDTGSAIKGEQRFDLALFDRQTALQFGRKKLKVWLIEEK
ncbi:MAG: 3D domain-containing protein [Firmicutes bacterium]|nr:3D domain-containing protein [Bacillota bacterium]